MRNVEKRHAPSTAAVARHQTQTIPSIHRSVTLHTYTHTPAPLKFTALSGAGHCALSNSVYERCAISQFMSGIRYQVERNVYNAHHRMSRRKYGRTSGKRARLVQPDASQAMEDARQRNANISRLPGSTNQISELLEKTAHEVIKYGIRSSSDIL